jgi:hypothetical protein
MMIENFIHSAVFSMEIRLQVKHTGEQSGARLAILRFCCLSNSHDRILLRTIPAIVNPRLNIFV